MSQLDANFDVEEVLGKLTMGQKVKLLAGNVSDIEIDGVVVVVDV